MDFCTYKFWAFFKIKFSLFSLPINRERRRKMRNIFIIFSSVNKIPMRSQWDHHRSSIFEIKSDSKNSESRDYLSPSSKPRIGPTRFRTMGLSAIIKRKPREKGNSPRSGNCPSAIIRGYPVKTSSFSCRFNIHCWLFVHRFISIRALNDLESIPELEATTPRHPNRANFENIDIRPVNVDLLRV